MRDMMSGGGGFSSIKISDIGGSDNNSYVWSTEKINKLLYDIKQGNQDIRKIRNSPFKDNDIDLKRENLPFEYTPQERRELAKCKKSFMYFIRNYCKIQTPKGRQYVRDAGGLRDFQEQILMSYHENPLNILMASRQTGKTVTSALYMLWFLIFQHEKTVLCVADNFTTTKELIEKFKIALEGLPFFMKPGIAKINEANVRFDNESRLVGRTTTKKSGIGLTVNLLYVDEFAHIEGAKLDEFYRAIFPTVTADPNGKIIITSTPNGKNKFWEIWRDAVSGKSTYKPLRVDWWQVKGRGEEWKQQVIADMGSEEDFNQEYGLQFHSADKLLLKSTDLIKLDTMASKYVPINLFFEEEYAHLNDYLRFHKNYANRTIDDFKFDPNNYVFSIDTSDGDGGDYQILNIYKVVALPVSALLRKKEIIKNELDTISLVQVGYFRSNEVSIKDFSAVCEKMIYEIFNPENCRIVLELNHKGDFLLDQFRENDSYWEGQLVHTKHTLAATSFKPGLRLGPTNKIKYCEKFKYMVTIDRIIPNDSHTIDELGAFGKSKGGLYRGQSGNDDLSMSSINISSLFESSQFWDIATETYERQPLEYQREVEEKIFSIHRTGGGKSLFNYDEMRGMNDAYNQPKNNKSKGQRSVFDLESLEQMKRMQNKFFKS